MKKNKMMRIASVLLVAVLLSTCAISGTFAKYATTASASATASVAKWDVKLGGTAITNSFTFDLFDTITEENGVDAEAHVADGKIAPGTAGSFTITVKNDSDVDAEYTVTLEGIDGLPLNFTYDTGAVALARNASKDITISWVWPFGNTVNDNQYSASSWTVAANITVSQVD